MARITVTLSIDGDKDGVGWHISRPGHAGESADTSGYGDDDMENKTSAARDWVLDCLRDYVNSAMNQAVYDEVKAK